MRAVRARVLQPPAVLLKCAVQRRRALSVALLRALCELAARVLVSEEDVVGRGQELRVEVLHSHDGVWSLRQDLQAASKS